MSMPAEGAYGLATYTHIGMRTDGRMDGWMGCRSLGVTTRILSFAAGPTQLAPLIYYAASKLFAL